MTKPHATRLRAARPVRVLARLLLACLLLAVPWACGGQAPAEAPLHSEPAATSEAAVAMFDAAEADLQAELLGGSGYAQPPGYPPQPSHPAQPGAAPAPQPSPGYPPAPQPQPQPAPLPYSTPPNGGSLEAVSQRCARACRALASMRRSADRVCDLDGESTKRCDNVQQRVAAARRLVRSLCPDCDA